MNLYSEYKARFTFYKINKSFPGLCEKFVYLERKGMKREYII
jgi:hypothetical protein